MADLSYREMLYIEARTATARRRPLRLASIFLIVFMVLYCLWELASGTAFERLVIHDLTVRPAAWIIQFLWPEQGVVAHEHRLISPAGRLNVLIGCDGLETLFLLLAAFAAYPFSFLIRFVGFGLGTALVFCTNQVRIVCLWHAWTHDRALFSLLHGFLLPALMIACCLALFLAFLVRYDKA